MACRLSAIALLAAAATLGGCFSEHSFPMIAERLAHIDPTPGRPALAARAWATSAHRQLAALLPPDERAALTTDALAVGDRSRDVFAYFDMNRRLLDNLLFNYNGLEMTASVCPPPGQVERPWPGFEALEVPLEDGTVLSARLGAPTRRAIPGSYVVVTHGLFGSLAGTDMRNQVAALQAAGHHVLALEMRGHGQTARKHPEYTISFGVAEAGDLLGVARWLKTQRGATRVGLVSFSITSYEALLAAWLDARPPEVANAERADAASPSFSPLLAALPAAVPTRRAEPAYNAGMLLISPPVDLVAAGDAFETRYSLVLDPLKATMQQRVAAVLRARGEVPTHSMWGFLESEFRRSVWAGRYPDFTDFRQDFLRLTDLRADNWRVGVRRMETVRTPVLVLAAANDPLGTAQGVADLFGRVKNPNCAAIVLKAGGHMGFPALSADYYYSLMVNFFDPTLGPTPHGPQSRPEHHSR